MLGNCNQIGDFVRMIPPTYDRKLVRIPKSPTLAPEFARLKNVTHLVQNADITKTCCMLFWIARIRKILLMQSLVYYESLISMIMVCYIQGLLFSLKTSYIEVKFDVSPKTLSEYFLVYTLNSDQLDEFIKISLS